MIDIVNNKDEIIAQEMKSVAHKIKKDINKNPKKYTPHKYWNEIILKLELTLH